MKRHYIFLLAWLLVLPFFASCDKDESLLASMDDVAVTGTATGITSTSALISGNLDIEFIEDELIDGGNQEDILFISKCGVLCSTSFNFPDDESTIEVNTVVKDGGFSVEAGGLQPSTNYYYKTFVSIDFILTDENGQPVMLDEDHPFILHYFNLYGSTRSFRTL